MSPTNERKIKVALMSDAIDRRPERTLVGRRLAEYLLARSDIELTLIHFDPMPEDPLYSQAHEILIPPVRFPWRSRFFSFLKFVLTTQESFDIAHWLVGRLYPFFWLMPAKRIVVTAHDGGSVFAPGVRSFSRTMYNMVLRYSQGSIAAVVGVSDFASQQIADAYGIPRNKIHTIYNGIDPQYKPLEENAVTPILHSHNLKHKGYFLYVGGMQTHKNVPALIKAYTRYRIQTKREEKLVLIGNPSYGATEVDEEVKKSQVKDDIVFIYFVEHKDLPAFYNGALGLVHPSLSEGFGLPPVEAMACGIPVISSNATSLPEVTGGAALLVDPHDTVSIAREMERLGGDQTLREELNKKGRERVKIFTWQRMGEGYVTLYKTLLTIV